MSTISGACPRIGILFKIEKFSKNKHSHTIDIASIVFCEFRRVWAGKRRLREGVLGQSLRRGIFKSILQISKL